MEKKVLVDYKKLLNFYRDYYKGCLTGAEGFCLVNKGQLRKIYFEPRDERCRTDLSQFKSSFIVFPQYYLYDKVKPDQVVGEVQKYVRKEELRISLNDEVLIEKLIKNYKALLEELKIYRQILMDDIFTGNVLYNDKDGFNLIDTTNWSVTGNDNYQDNKFNLDDSIIEVILSDILEITQFSFCNLSFVNGLKKLGDYGMQLSEVINANLSKDYHVIEFLQLCQLLGNKMDVYFENSLYDVKKCVKLLKNS